VAMLVAILLSGTRSAWLMMIFIGFLFAWQFLPKSRWQTLLKAGLLVLVMGWVIAMLVPDFQQRIDRRAPILTDQDNALDYALADRLPIWHSGWEMYKKHPINGVGARAFRKAYPHFAEDNDPWLAQDGVSLQAHHWVLELMAETGTLGF